MDCCRPVDRDVCLVGLERKQSNGRLFVDYHSCKQTVKGGVQEQTLIGTLPRPYPFNQKDNCHTEPKLNLTL